MAENDVCLFDSTFDPATGIIPQFETIDDNVIMILSEWNKLRNT
jgi:hypothetical protein